MKRTIKFLALAAALALFAAPTLAQKQECNDENKANWYKTFYDNFKGTVEQQKTAYDAAIAYRDSCPADPNDKQLDYMLKWVKKYEEVVNKGKAGKDFEAAFQSKNYPEIMRLGKKILETEPDNAPVNIVMGVTGLQSPAVLADSAQAAKKAISLIEAGKPFAPIATRDQALAYLNWVVGKAAVTSAPADAITNLLKAARFESDVKKTAQFYLDLAAAYENGPRAKLSEEYTASLNPDKTETTQSKVILENLNQVIDRQIDALARAAALADAANKKSVMDSLTELYKYRNKSDAGLTELVASVLSKPIPDVPTPITSLPTPMTTNPTTNTGTNGTTSAGTQTGTAKPAASPTPSKKPPKR